MTSRNSFTSTFTIAIMLMLCVRNSMGKFKIFNGEDIKDWSKNDYKFMVFLRDGDKCSGSWLGGTKVLTAAHCFCKKIPSSTVLFEYTTKGSTPTESIAIVSHAIPTEFGKCPKTDEENPNKAYDISVATLKSAPVKCKAMMTISMNYKTIPAVGTVMKIVGYGRNGSTPSGDLRLGKAKFATCTPRYKNGALCLHKDAAFHEQHNDKGDSGAPLLLPVAGGVECVGVYSGPNTMEGPPDVYEMVYAGTKMNEDFIKKNL